MRVLLMGGTGEVGHHIANGLVERGHEVTVLTRGRDGRGFPLNERVRRVQADKGDAAAFEQAAVPLHPEVVIDTVPSDASVRNVHGLFAGKIRHYIHCSSTGVYGPLQYVPGDEAHPWEPIADDFYVTCIRRDQLAMGLHGGNFPVTILRPTMIIGPGALPVDNLGGRGAWFLRELAANRPLELAEDGDVLVQAGLNADLARAFVLAAEQPERAAGEIFNISCARAVTLRDYLGFFKEALGSTSPLAPTPVETMLANHRDDGRVDEYWLRFLCRHMCFDLTKARERLGYNPPHDLRASARMVVEWAKGTGRV
jgi:nucleoside-diphosphate-sugar epimerase